MYWGKILYLTSIILIVLTNYTVSQFLFFRHLEIDYQNTRYNKQLIGFLPLDTPTCALFLLYQFLCFMMFWGFFKSHFTDPGYIDRSKILDHEKEQYLKPPTEENFKKYLKNHSDKNLMKKIVKQFELENESEFQIYPEKLIKHCQKCYNTFSQKQIQSKQFSENLNEYFWKPIRAHHCKQCNKCVQQMDHHCLWIDNCVGVKNIKYFLLFNLYGCIFILYSSIGLCFSIFFNVKKDMDQSFLVYFMLLLNLFFLILTYQYFSDILGSIEVNRSEVEKKQKLFGKPYGLYDSLEKFLGARVSTMLFPVQGKILNVRNNYLELLYTQKQLNLQPTLQTAIYLEDNFLYKESAIHDFYAKYQI